MTRLEKVIDSRWFKIILLALWGAVILVCILNMDNITAESIIEFSPKNKLSAAGVMMLLFALKSLSVVVYSGILYAALGVMFELPAAMLLSVLGSVICVTIPYYLGKLLGSKYIEKLEVKYPKLTLVRNVHVGNDFLFVMLVRFIAYIPFDVTSIYMGAIKLPYGKYLLGSLVGMSTLLIPMTVLGSSIETPGTPAFIISFSVHLILTVVGSVYLIRSAKKNIKKAKEA